MAAATTQSFPLLNPFHPYTQIEKKFSLRDEVKNNENKDQNEIDLHQTNKQSSNLSSFTACKDDKKNFTTNPLLTNRQMKDFGASLLQPDMSKILMQGQSLQMMQSHLQSSNVFVPRNESQSMLQSTSLPPMFNNSMISPFLQTASRPGVRLPSMLADNYSSRYSLLNQPNTTLCSTSFTEKKDLDNSL